MFKAMMPIVPSSLLVGGQPRAISKIRNPAAKAMMVAAYISYILIFINFNILTPALAPPQFYN
jgi:hypothetical protein